MLSQLMGISTDVDIIDHKHQVEEQKQLAQSCLSSPLQEILLSFSSNFQPSTSFANSPNSVPHFYSETLGWVGGSRSVCTTQSRLILVRLIYDLALLVRPHGPVIHHHCNNGGGFTAGRNHLSAAEIVVRMIRPTNVAAGANSE